MSTQHEPEMGSSKTRSTSADEVIYGLRRITWYKLFLCVTVFKVLGLLAVGQVPFALIGAALIYAFVIRPMRALT